MHAFLISIKTRFVALHTRHTICKTNYTSNASFLPLKKFVNVEGTWWKHKENCKKNSNSYCKRYVLDKTFSRKCVLHLLFIILLCFAFPMLLNATIFFSFPCLTWLLFIIIVVAFFLKMFDAICINQKQHLLSCSNSKWD